MNVQVDPERCQGHGRCYLALPELFGADDLGNGREIGSGNVPAALLHQARIAVANCPEQAISLGGTGTAG